MSVYTNILWGLLLFAYNTTVDNLYILLYYTYIFTFPLVIIDLTICLKRIFTTSSRGKTKIKNKPSIPNIIYTRVKYYIIILWWWILDIRDTKPGALCGNNDNDDVNDGVLWFFINKNQMFSESMLTNDIRASLCYLRYYAHA